MIQLQCTNCNTTLNIDDAFAGGVCRCQHCGTIQTVPATRSGPEGRSAAPSQQPSPKPLYKRKARIESALSPYSDDLEKAADQIPSSGLGNSVLVNGVNRRAAENVPLSSQLVMSSIPMSSQMPMSPTTMTTAEARQRQAQAQAPKLHVHALPGTQPAPRSHRKLLLGISGALTAVVLVGGVWMFWGRTPKTSTDESPLLPTTELRSEDAAMLAAPKPTMAGVELKGDTFTYIIDRSGCSPQVFSNMLRACERSMETLGAGRKFQVVVINADHPILYPKSGPQNANTSNRKGLTKAVGEEVYFGSSKNTVDLIAKAMDGEPDALILLSANEETTAFSESVVSAMGKKSRPVFTFYVGSATSNEGLSELANTTGGEYNALNLANIK